MSQSPPDHTAVLLLAHGTPDVLGEMAEYLAKVTGGRALPHEVVEELQHRYAQIGLRETPGEEAPPLTRWTFTQAHMLQQALAAAGHPLRVYTAMRNWHPYIADVVRANPRRRHHPPHRHLPRPAKLPHQHRPLPPRPHRRA